jgi:tetratricopeptide (TPR) repeat protein
MPSRHYFWTLVLLICISCSTFFKRRSEFEKGLIEYQKDHYQQAVIHFDVYYNEHPESQTTLYYLYDCYKKLKDEIKSVHVLEQLINIGSTDENAYLNLFLFYRRNKKYQEMFAFLNGLQPSINRVVNEKYTLTRRLFAEIVCGASDRPIYADPMVFAVSENYLPLFPDSKFYEYDTLTNGNLIILFDRLVDPIYPKDFFAMKKIQNNSYLYIPYMRLVHLGIMPFNADLDPGKWAPLTSAVTGVAQLKKRGLIE